MTVQQAVIAEPFGEVCGSGLPNLDEVAQASLEPNLYPSQEVIIMMFWVAPSKVLTVSKPYSALEKPRGIYGESKGTCRGIKRDTDGLRSIEGLNG